MSTTPEPSAAHRLVGDITPKPAEPTDDVLFGDVWARPELPCRDRSLVIVAALVANGSTEQLVSHLRLAKVLVGGPRFEPEPPLPTLVSGDIGLTSTIAKDGGRRPGSGRAAPAGRQLAAPA